MYQKAKIVGLVTNSTLDGYMAIIPATKGKLQELIDVFKDKRLNTIMTISVNYSLAPKALVSGNGAAYDDMKNEQPKALKKYEKN